MKIHWKSAALMCIGLLGITAAPALAKKKSSIKEPAQLAAGFALEVYEDGSAHATVTVDPAAPVRDVVIWSGDGEFGPAEEAEPGAWVAEAADGGACFSATADLVIGPSKSKKGCIESITVRHSSGEYLGASGDAVGHPNTIFLASNGDIGAIHTSCSHCIRVGDFDESGQFEITDIVDDGLLTLKCEGGTAAKSKPAKDALHKLFKKGSLLLSLTAGACGAESSCEEVEHEEPEEQQEPEEPRKPVFDEEEGFEGDVF